MEYVYYKIFCPKVTTYQYLVLLLLFKTFRTLTYIILILLEKGIDSHDIDLPGKKVFVTSKTLQKDGVEEIIKKTGLDTTFVGEKDA